MPIKFSNFFCEEVHLSLLKALKMHRAYIKKEFVAIDVELCYVAFASRKSSKFKEYRCVVILLTSLMDYNMLTSMSDLPRGSNQSSLEQWSLSPTCLCRISLNN